MVISNKFVILFLDLIGYDGITLYPFILVRNKYSKTLINHEKIHLAQYKELFIIGFLVIYLYDFIVNYIKFRNFNKAYRKIGFEIEAYLYQSEPNYLYRREKYIWTKFRGAS
jgi:hypothetical protein